MIPSNILNLTNTEDAQNPAEFGSAKRHPWQSWRERYKKHWPRLDPIIADIVAKDPPPADGKGLYQYSRFENHKQYLALIGQTLYRFDDEEEEEDAEGDEDDEMVDEADSLQQLSAKFWTLKDKIS